MQFRKALLILKCNGNIDWLVFITTTIGGRTYEDKGRHVRPPHNADAIIRLFGSVRRFIRGARDH